MKMTAFEFVDAARFQKGAQVNPAAVGDHLELLRKQHNGELTPKAVVENARNDNSPLHTFFEWNDGEAAEQFRLQQARGLIRSVVAIYTAEGKPRIRTRAYIHIAEPHPHYREAGHVMSEDVTRKAVIQRAWKELEAWRKRYKDLKEFSELFEVIDEVQLNLDIKHKH